MANLYKQYLRTNHSYSMPTLSYLITFIILIQRPMIVIAQTNEHQSMFVSNNNLGSNSPSFNNDDTIYDRSDIYDDMEDFDDYLLPSSTTSISQIKFTHNIDSPLQPAPNDEYNEPLYSYQNYINDDNLDHEMVNKDQSQLFNKQIPIDHLDIKPTLTYSNNKNNFDFSSTTGLPFLTSSLWRHLLSKPGILVGIMGGIIIGILSAILLVMFIIYRMRKKDEGSYALEEGPRKSPSHAYTRVSSREFFA